MLFSSVAKKRCQMGESGLCIPDVRAQRDPGALEKNVVEA